MSPRFWSFALQWARVGINAGLFLIAARYLTLAEIGAFAPIRLTQGLHKAGIGESVIILGPRQRRQDALFALSVGSGIALSLSFATFGVALTAPLLIALSVVPLLNGIGAVSEGIVRQRLNLRTLALRTIASQSIAALLALWILRNGSGPWALVAFALTHAALNAALSYHLAAWRPHSLPNWQNQRLISRLVIEISARDLLSAALFPLMQLATSLAFGLPAAGAFQIATRILSLIEALTLSPLRFLALPQLRQLPSAQRTTALPAHLRLTATLSLWVWGAALLMPINQTLIAAGHTRQVLHRAALIVTLSCVFATFAPTPTASVSLSALLTALWHLTRAMPLLGLTLRALSPLTAPLSAAAIVAMLFALLPPLVQLSIGSALYAAFLLIPRRKAAI